MTEKFHWFDYITHDCGCFADYTESYTLKINGQDFDMCRDCFMFWYRQ